MPLAISSCRATGRAGSASRVAHLLAGGARDTRPLPRDTCLAANFDWACRHESNHGYDESSAWGRVVAVDDHGITVELAESASSSWEDWFKEHLTHSDTTLRQVTIEIAEVNDGKPMLRYAGAGFRHTG